MEINKIGSTAIISGNIELVYKYDADHRCKTVGAGPKTLLLGVSRITPQGRALAVTLRNNHGVPVTHLAKRVNINPSPEGTSLFIVLSDGKTRKVKIDGWTCERTLIREADTITTEILTK